MFLLDGKPQALDVPFTDIEGIQRPANWIRFASPEERLEAGLTEEPDAPNPIYDQRFFWGYDADGELIPKDHLQLVSQWVSQTKNTANTLLAPTDWMVIREADNATECPVEIRGWRQAIRVAAGEKIAMIEGTVDSAEVAEYITGSLYHAWPSDPNSPAPVAAEPIPSDDVVSFSNGFTSAGFSGSTVEML